DGIVPAVLRPHIRPSTALSAALGALALAACAGAPATHRAARAAPPPAARAAATRPAPDAGAPIAAPAAAGRAAPRVGCDARLPARTDGPDYTVYNVNTGQPGDVFGVYFGDAPSPRSHPGDEFSVALGPVAMRGRAWAEGARRRVEAVGLLPCATPRYVHV